MRERMIEVKISDTKLKEMIYARIAWWRDSYDEALRTLLEVYFDEAVDNGDLDGTELDIEKLVDNAIVNDFDVKFAEVDERQVAQLIDCRSGEVVKEIEWETEEA